MRLLDDIAQTPVRCIELEHPRLGTRRFPAAAQMRDEILAAPLRYVLDDNASRFCRNALSDDAETLAAAQFLLRIPGEKIWIEWREPDANAMSPSVECARLGVLVESDEGGRSGQMTVFAEGSAGLGPDMLQARLVFDLDQVAVIQAPGEFTLSASRFPRLDPLVRHCKARLAPEWRSYFEEIGAPAGTGEEAARRVGPTFLFVTAFFLLLTQVPCFRAEASCLDPLNQRRQKVGKPALLEHVEVRLQLSGTPTYDSSPRLSDRRGSRLHQVRGHFFLRDGKLIWRRPHARGRADLGRLATRTTMVGYRQHA